MKIKVRTQVELDKAVSKGAVAICIGGGHFEAWDNSSVEARENSSVKACGNSSVVALGNSSVEARENSSVKACGNSSVVALGNSSVEALGNSSVEALGNSSVVALENSSVVAWDNSSVVALGNVFVRLFNCLKIEISIPVIVMRHNKKIKVDGGTVIDALKPQNAREWCDFYGIKVNNGKAVLFKAVDINYDSYRGFNYSPGTIPVAPDWDGGEKECGNGLHFSSHPQIANSFFNSAVRFLACPINLSDIAVHPDGKYPEKIKAMGCCDPIWEVDINGKEIK